MNESEQQTLERLSAGDETAFAMIFKAYYRTLCNYAFTFVRDRDEAEEIVQNSFLAFWERRPAAGIQTSLKSYLFSMVRNASLNRLKHEQVRKRHAAEVQREDRGVETTSQQVMGTELERRISTAVESLPEQCRLIFKMNRFEDMRYAEIADHLHLSVKTVENQIGKALKILREQLGDYLPLLLLVLNTFFH